MWKLPQKVFISAAKKEEVRYTKAANIELKHVHNGKNFSSGLDGIPVLHHPPYQAYYSAISELIGPQHRVLELAAGSGRHTGVLVDTGATIYALDISQESLNVLRIRTENRVITVCASLNNIPLDLDSFDFIVGCGGMSYVSNSALLFEIKRMLKPGGSVIFLDTLNHNLIYRANRFLQFLAGKRTWPTLYRMPTISFLNSIGNAFESTTLIMFGNFLWLEYLFSKIGKNSSSKFLNLLEKHQKQRGAFKFLLVCKKLTQ
jgi:ubiquinone/menaquinone biosynthesis C-methylase UbiE